MVVPSPRKVFSTALLGAKLHGTMADILPGTRIADRYDIARAIGRGAFGRTFLARDRTNERLVAMKMLDPKGTADLKALEMFEREATVMRAMRHHGIPEVIDLVRDSASGVVTTYLVMEYIEGASILTIIDEKRQLDPADVLHLFLELLGILDYLHSRVPPIVHRDIKPGNIIVRLDGQPTLVDFGAVRREYMAPDEAGSTIVGTYGYMPYEQYMGQATPASDLYSLAATFLHLLTGRPPRDFMNSEGRIEVPEGLPGDARLQPVIARLLRPSPAERFASAREVRHALLGGTAVVTSRSTSRGLVHRALDLSVLGPTPRPLTGEIKALLNRVAPRAREMMDSSAKPGGSAGALDWLSLIFFSVVTMGVLPAVYTAMSRARRRRLRRFFRDALPATGEVLSIEMDKTAFEGKISKVTYQFEADGVLHRDADEVLPAITNRWQPGDRVQILYLPDFDYDSVIISAR